MRATASAIFALLVVACACVCVSGCKKADGPAPRDLADDIDAIESALNETDRELSNEGVVVAYRSTPGTFAEPGAAEVTPTTPPVEPPELDGETLSPEPPDPAPDVPTTDMGDDAPVLHSPEPSEEPTAMTVRELEREKSPRRNRSRRVKAGKGGPPTQCERICGLAESTCDLRDKICRMAERHFGDIRYATSCQRAEDQCDAVRSRCDSCAA